MNSEFDELKFIQNAYSALYSLPNIPIGEFEKPNYGTIIQAERVLDWFFNAITPGLVKIEITADLEGGVIVRLARETKNIWINFMNNGGKYMRSYDWNIKNNDKYSHQKYDEDQEYDKLDMIDFILN